MSLKNHGERGVAAVEFALALPIFMVTIFAVVEFGSAFHKQQIITSAVHEAARLGVLAGDPRPTASEIRLRAYDYLDQVGLDSAEAIVIVSGASGNSGDPLRVQIDYPTDFTMLSRFTSAEDGPIPGKVLLKARVVAALE